MKDVHKILMVCLGNICRSPVAEGIMRSKLEAIDLAFEVDSAGTSNNHVGENPDARSVKNAVKNGIDISKLKARQFKVTDFDYFDIIYVMDENNKSDVLSLARNEDDMAKVKLILSEIPGSTYKSVPDPYFGGETGFQLVFELLDKACESVAQQLLDKTISIKQ